MTKQISLASYTDFEKELLALARMVAHARQSAQDLDIAMPTYCLDVAMAAILEELENHGIGVRNNSMKTGSGVPAHYN